MAAETANALLSANRLPGRLADNVVHFARVLRTAGLPVGSDRVVLALEALQSAGLERRVDFYAVLRTCMLDRHEHLAVFDQAFLLFWRDPDLSGRMRALLLPQIQLKPGVLPNHKENRRLADALFPHMAQAPEPPEPPQEVQIDAAWTVSDRERLQRADFDTMTAEEWREARRAIARLRPQLEQLPTRRHGPSNRPGRLDLRATLRDSARHGGDVLRPRWRQAQQQPVPLLVLADISGSMSRYTRTLLHFAHALSQAGTPVESFVFGTRLNRITKLLAHRDPDIAVAEVVRAVPDWSGGTRLAASLEAFERRWARRVLPGHATVVLITDGLEHGDAAVLARLDAAAAQLKRRCRRLLWLNPLLRYDKFEPRAAGVRTLMPHVDRFLPAHNLASIDTLVKVLRG